MLEPHPVTAQPLFASAFVSVVKTSTGEANRGTTGALRGEMNQSASRVRRAARQFRRRGPMSSA